MAPVEDWHPWKIGQLGIAEPNDYLLRGTYMLKG
jgi:hypothetical protein